MKAFVTFGDRNDPDRFSKIGLRLISEGIHDVSLMELLEERYPGFSRNEADRHSALDLTVPLQSYDYLPSGGSMQVDSDRRILPLAASSVVITDVYRGQSVIRQPIVVVNVTCPGPWDVFMVKVNGREYRPERGAKIGDIVPGAEISVCVAYMGDDPTGAFFGCVIREGEIHKP
jgi:hypothetical protein